MMTGVVRWALGVSLLVAVWFNAHWSVALTLTLVVVWIEMQNYEMYCEEPGSTNWMDDGPLHTLRKQPSEERET